MRYIWTWQQSMAEAHPWLRRWPFNWKRWKNPPADYPRDKRRLNKTMVTDSRPIVWPAEFRDTYLKLDVRQKPWKGSVGGKPVQYVSHSMSKRIKVQNIYGGDRFVYGEFYKSYKPGESYDVAVPGPFRYGWGVEGYPNATNGGDMHWYGIDVEGCAYEMIAFWQTDWSCVHYRKYDPDGNIVDGIPASRGATNKGNVQWTDLAWDNGDEPHRLGITFTNLGHSDEGVGDSPEPYASWDDPAYGKVYRLSEAEYSRQIALGPDQNQRNFLDSLRFYGAVPYDKGGQEWQGKIGMIAGSQQADSSVAELKIPLEELERAF